MASEDKLLLRRKLRQLGLRHLPALPTPIPDIESYKERLKKRSLALQSARPARTVSTTLTKLPRLKQSNKKPLGTSTIERSKVNLSEVEMYMLFRSRVEMRPIPPLNPRWIQRILGRFDITSETTKCKLEKIIMEVQQLHDQIISSLSVRQVLLVPGKNKSSGKNVREWPELSLTRKKAFLKHRCQLQRKLFLLDPSFRMLLTLCRDSFAHMVILETSTFSGKNAIDCNSLLEIVHNECFNSEDKILHKYRPADHLNPRCPTRGMALLNWFPQVVKIVSTAGKSKSGQEASSFYKCVTSVLSAQLKDLVYRSVQAFVNICGSGSIVIILTLEVVRGSINASPTIEDLNSVFISATFKQITECLKNIPTVDSWLSGDAVTMMAVDLPETVLEEAHNQVNAILQQQYNSPEAFILELTNKYSHLLNGESMKAIGDFLKLPHPFKDYCQLIERYHDLTYVIGVIPDIKQFSIFYLNCRHLKETLLKETFRHRDHLLNYVAELNRQSNYNLCRSLAEVKGRTFKVPETTKQMVKLRRYIEHVENVDLAKLESEAKFSYERLLFLLNLYDFNDDDFTLNGFTLTVPAQIRPIIQKTNQILDDCHLRFEEALQCRIEKVGLEIEKLQLRVKELDECGQIMMINQYVQDGKSIRRRIDGLQEIIRQINHEELLFKYPMSSFPELDDVILTLSLFQYLFDLISKWQRTNHKWMDGNFLDLDSDTIEMELNHFASEFLRLQQVFRSRQKQQELSGGGKRGGVRWGNDDDEEGDQSLTPPVRLCVTSLDQTRQFRINMPIINALCQPGIRPRHWKQMASILNFEIVPESSAASGFTTLSKVLKLDLYPYLEALEVVTAAAAKEYATERSIRKLLHEWDHVNLTTIQFRDTGKLILSSIDDVQQMLDDHIVKIQTIRGSLYIGPFEEEVTLWEKKLVRTVETLDEWLKVQSQWIYLEPIFSSEDIVRQMPKEGILFEKVDKEWVDIMKVVRRDARVMSTAGDEDMLTKLRAADAILEEINVGVEDYLEQKRLDFPRFFFLSNDEMLEILSETKDPHRVQPHLIKCFEGIGRLEFDQNTIVAMKSVEGEKVQLFNVINPANAKGQVEKWLLEVQESMRNSVKRHLIMAQEAYKDEERTTWVKMWPGQIVLAVTQLYWTGKVHDAIINGPKFLENYAENIKKRMVDVVDLVRSDCLTQQLRTTLNSLLVLDVHARDVVNQLLSSNVDSVDDFKWLSQLRYYWIENKLSVQMVNTSINYCYEYLGNTSRLVMTPLTDRCYRTLVAAFHLHLNGAPEGPAGTGKTETVKDLAKAIAVQCVVFNCSDGLDYLAMGKFFKGLTCTGAWACFDEFNRIESEVLSVVAEQMLTIVLAVRANCQSFVFEGTKLVLNRNCFTCITMNPNYAGRSQLPDNLKALFRTVAMMVPDYVTIAEVSLFSYGFVDAQNLSVKIVTTYRLCSEQLSIQSHYDYGMRAVKTVLWAAGQFKLQTPDISEDNIILKALLEVNLPKFLPQDIPLFKAIVADLFPNLQWPLQSNMQLLRIAEKVCHKRNLQPEKPFLEKLAQVYETMLVRHGFMLVGDAMGSKTTLLRVLAESLSEFGKPVQWETINPKSMPLSCLYGQFDPASHEWTDGVVAHVFRRFSSSDTEGYKWIIFDGPVDPVWIENLNAVLDDNRKLCLMSGEVIPMSSCMRIVFEVSDLLYASPATVSRCGMIYVQPEVFGWLPLVKSFVNNASNTLWYSEGFQHLLRVILDWLLPPTLEFVCRQSHLVISMSTNYLVDTYLDMLNAIMTNACNGRKETEVKYAPLWLIASSVFSLIWSIGALLNADGRQEFSFFIRQLLSGKMTDSSPIPADIAKVDFIWMPSESGVFDYFYEFRQRGQWRLWSDVLWSMEQSIESQSSVWQLTVPTIDMVRCEHLLELNGRKPILLVGPTGTGKTTYVNHYLARNESNGVNTVLVSLAGRSEASQTQDVIVGELEKRRKGTYGPPIGKKCVVFIDDLHRPSKEIYGAQPPLELLRQYLDHKHWFDKKELTKLKLIDVSFVATATTYVGQQQMTNNRLLRHFHIVDVNAFSLDTLQRIFSTTLNHHFRLEAFPSEHFSVLNAIVGATLTVYNDIFHHLLPTPQKMHYVFNLRDVSSVILGCCRIKKAAVVNKRTFTRLWIHEMLRIFYDKLSDADDRSWLFGHLRENVRLHFKDNFDVVCERLAAVKNRKINEEDLQHLMFGDYLKPHLAIEDRLYEEVASLEQFNKVCETSVLDYNNVNKTRMQLVLTPYVLQHLSRLCRVFRIPRGHALLVGVSGVGRQTLTRLAAFLSGLNVVKPEMSKNYGRNEWREDIKSLLRAVGIQGKPTVFLLTDNYLRNEIFLEDVESLLKSAEVSNLFTPDERQDLVQMLRSEGSQQNYATFVNRCRVNLHLVMTINPKSDIFQRQIHLFPSLVTCCTINCMPQWPSDTIEKVAYNQLQPLNLGDCQDVIVSTCQYFHATSRVLNEDHITPMTFLQLLETFKNLLVKREKHLMMAKERYKAGLAKLSMSSQQIAVMQEELETLKPRLEEAAGNAKEMMETIASESQELEKKKKILKEDESVVEKKAKEANALREECEADLAEAVPALDAAVASLDTLKPADITVLKSMKNPPPAVKLVTEAVCVMLDIPPEKSTEIGAKKKALDYWSPSKKMLGELSFLSKLKTYNKDELKDGLMLKIRKEYLPNPDFNLQVVSKASSAAEGLCQWICAMELYDRMAKIVAPKKSRLAEAEDLVTSLLSTLRSKRGELAITESHLSILQRQLEGTIKEKQALEKQINLCTVKLGRARHLIDGLAEEKVRWSNEVSLIDETLRKLAGDTLLAAGVVTYLGPFKIIQRHSVLEKWMDYLKENLVAYSENFSLAVVLGDPLEIQTWIIAGLPNDKFSIDNAVIVSNTIRWPLMIDPQSQALNWLKATEGEKGLITVKPFTSEYPRHLEACVQNGQTVLIENIGEELDPLLEPILLKETFKQTGIEMIRYGDKAIEYNHRFRLLISTRLHDPHFLPEVATKVSIVNFCVTLEGLEDQLLGLLVAKERPELETAHRNLVLESSNNRRKLRELEDKVLATMSTSKGNLLDDETAIEVLDTSKQVSVELLAKQKAAEINEEKIIQSRKIYQPVANHAAILYFAVSNLHRVDPMYHFSLNWFIKLFISTIDQCEKNDNVDVHLQNLTNCLTFSVYVNVSRSIFEKDKLLLSFLLYISLLRGRGSITEQEITFFLTGGVAFSRPESNPFSDWLDERAWTEINTLFSLRGPFQNLKRDMLSNENEWRKYAQHSHPHLQPLPAPTNQSLNHFGCLCVLRCLRPDKVILGVITVLKKELGDPYIHSVPFNLENSFKESDATTPLLFLLSTGNDPLTEWLRLARNHNIPESNCHIISLGQGQGARALQVVEQAKETGDWVLLQNCHLAVKWLPDLESLCENFSVETVNSNFRLWLTSYSSNKFPVAICQNSIKITNEAPTGLKQRLLQIYTNEPLNEGSFFTFDNNNKDKLKGFLKLVYGLSLFHASVCERRKYGSIGWNIPYVFDPFDLVISLHQLKMYVSEYHVIPFEAITYMIGECNYGGRVTDHWDRRVLVNLLSDLCNPNVVADGDYKLIPQLSSYEEYLGYIKKMNSEQDPEIYGLHSNVDISKNIQDSQALRDSLLLVLDTHLEVVSGTSRNTSKTGDDTMVNLIKGILEKIPQNFNIEEAEQKFPVIYSDSMNNLLVQEMWRYNR